MLKAKCGRKKSRSNLAATRCDYRARCDLDWRRVARGRIWVCRSTCISVQRCMCIIRSPMCLRQVAHVCRSIEGGRSSDERPPSVLSSIMRLLRCGGLDRGSGCGGGARVVGRKAEGLAHRSDGVVQREARYEVSCQEVFGPVVTVTPYRQLSEAVALLNNRTMIAGRSVHADINKIFYAFRI